MDTWTVGDVVYHAFNTHQDDGTPITLAGTPSLSVYKDDGTTEDTGDITLTVGFDSVTGLHMFKIDTSIDTTFYVAGHTYTVTIDAGTVDGISVVGTVVYTFKLAAAATADTDYTATLASILAKLTELLSRNRRW